MKTLISLLTFVITTAAIGFTQDQRPFVHPSAVVFMYTPSDSTQYDAYQGTLAGWGGRPRSRDEQDVASYSARVAEAQKRGMKFCGSVDFLVDFGGYIDFNPNHFMEAACRDLDDKPLQVPWLFDHKHKGHPAYWFCFNNPDYQKYLLDQAERACLAPIDGLHIDDYGGTSNCSDYNGGCFCSHCRDGFRDFLKENFSADQLKEKGIENIDSFDYKAFLQSKNITAEIYRKQHHTVPLIDDFQHYQNGCMLQRISTVFEHAEKLRGKPLLRSINSSANSPRTLIPSAIIDYFCGEVGHDAASQAISTEPVFVFKVVEALNRRQTATASGQDWAWIKANNKPGLVKLWIAQAYAFGSCFMVPHNQWCFTQELGTHWWQGKPEDFAYLYRFVREKKVLFERYIPLTNTALAYGRDDYPKIVKVADEMIQANIPFSISVVHHNRFNLPIKRLTPDRTNYTVSPYYLVFPSGIPNSFAEIGHGSIRVAWDGIESLKAYQKKQLKVEGAENIRVSLRYIGDGKSPVVCHVLNQNYSPEEDNVKPVNVKISISKNLLEQAKASLEVSQVTVHQTNQESVKIEKMVDGDYVTFELKSAGLWSIVEM